MSLSQSVSVLGEAIERIARVNYENRLTKNEFSYLLQRTAGLSCSLIYEMGV